MIYGNGVFVDYDDTNLMIRNWISGRYSKENVKNGWLPLDVYKRQTLTGFQPQTEIPTWMSKNDILILPSIHDGWGAVVNLSLIHI